MRRTTVGFLGLALILLGAGAAAAANEAHEPTDLAIRRQLGLPPESARGQIEILDVGHDPMDTMLSIVARRSGGGWRVSYACAPSPACGEHPVRDYALSSQASGQVDALLDRLRRGQEPDGLSPSSHMLGGYLKVTVDDRGFRHGYDRVGQWGKMLGELRQLLSPPEQAH
ncbi:hypothetical protein NZL82_06085 [Sphingomonas sanguinis]|uniref:hypothetical protein n=1 Tax=Sphingomonas sp. LC-1 TaxID=3110957 RepID=UPI0021BA7394|nr:hypothetical protein [Sphingomonas sp. LC-1]MCT8001447.1 hypothetical protein [Sphingomonas sp. LC-1]